MSGRRASARRLLAVGALAAGAVLALGACGGDDGGGSSSDDSSSTGGGPSATVAGATEIDVTASNYAFDPDSFEVAAGEDFTVVLEAQDSLHDFVIEGADGFVEAGVGDTAAGGFKVDEPGEYTFYCSISNHRALGMEGTLTVT